MIRFNKERLTTLYLGRTINKLVNYFGSIFQHPCLPRSQAFINSVLNTVALNMHWSFVYIGSLQSANSEQYSEFTILLLLQLLDTVHQSGLNNNFLPVLLLLLHVQNINEIVPEVTQVQLP